ncbi:hypothetical protein Tco_1028929 [Tanacetum coccineum]|uniref:Uncharacterized protein n=1 Tax=Tanacetum coccineum TaxID=301880 RepID=A0ABQ5G1Z9_9ASTR
MNSTELERSATRLKAFDVAVDVVNFGIQRLRPRNKFQLLKDFISFADNGDNSRYLYAPSGSPTPLWQQILKSPLAPVPFSKLEEEIRTGVDTKRVQSNVDQTMVGKRRKTLKMKEGGLTRFKDRPSLD